MILTNANFKAIGFESTMWKFSWRKKKDSYVAIQITRANQTTGNNKTSISILDTRDYPYKPPIWEGEIRSIEEMRLKIEELHSVFSKILNDSNYVWEFN